MFKIKACEKITTGIWLIFRALFFEHNAEIGQKDHLWMGTNSHFFTAILRAEAGYEAFHILSIAAAVFVFTDDPVKEFKGELEAGHLLKRISDVQNFQSKSH